MSLLLNLSTTTPAPTGIRSIAFDIYTYFDLTILGSASLAMVLATGAFIYVCCCEKKAKKKVPKDPEYGKIKGQELNRMKHPGGGGGNRVSPSGFDDPRKVDKPVSRDASFGGYEQVRRHERRPDDRRREERHTEDRRGQDRHKDNRRREERRKDIYDDKTEDRRKNVRHGQESRSEDKRRLTNNEM